MDVKKRHLFDPSPGGIHARMTPILRSPLHGPGRDKQLRQRDSVTYAAIALAPSHMGLVSQRISEPSARYVRKNGIERLRDRDPARISEHSTNAFAMGGENAVAKIPIVSESNERKGTGIGFFRRINCFALQSASSPTV